MKNLHNKIAIFATSLLVTSAAVYMYSPVLGSNAADASVDVNVEVNPIISLSLDTNALNFSLTPTSSGVFESKPIVATVDTNSTGGYELYFSSIDDQTAMTSLTSESTITSTFANTVTSTTMTNNTWGYSLDNTDFSKIPTLTNHVTLKNLDHLPSVAEKTTTTNIGVKIDSTLASGTYNKKVLFSAVAHESITPTLHDLTSMQQMSTGICAATTTPLNTATLIDWDGSHHGDNAYIPRKALTDTRDGKHYLVSKLADGNCWMTQNLALDLSTNVTLTSDTTDLNSKSAWAPDVTTETELSSWGKYDDMSKIVQNEELFRKANSYHPVSSESFFRGGTAMTSTPTANTDEYLWESAGNYYSWYAATAKSGTLEMVAGDVASDSICPKGWQLPRSTGVKSFDALINTAYSNIGNNVLSYPFNLILAGSCQRISMAYQGMISNIWSSEVKEYAISYELGYSSSALNVQGYMPHNYGLSIRCVAR